VDFKLFLVSLGTTVFLGNLISHGVVHRFSEALFLPPLTYVPRGNPPRGTYHLGSRVNSSYPTINRGIPPRGNYAQSGGYPFIHTSGSGGYFSGANYGQGSSIPLGTMSISGVNHFGGMFSPSSSNVSGSPFISKYNLVGACLIPGAAMLLGVLPSLRELTLLELRILLGTKIWGDLMVHIDTRCFVIHPVFIFQYIISFHGDIRLLDLLSPISRDN
jgi:hypothetical protein